MSRSLGVSMWVAHIVCLTGAVLASTAVRAQTSSQPGAPADTLTVTGRVVNALNGNAIPRALVNLNSRAVLTDALGRFEFPQFANPAASSSGSAPGSARAYVLVTKPGFAAALDAQEAMGQQAVADVSVPLELKLYPDALITGTVSGGDLQPLSKLSLTLYREMGDESARRLLPVAFSQTNSRGEYRFEQPAGRYGLLLRYTPRAPETGEAVLPQRFPEQTSSDTPASFVVGPGEERKIDLQARTGIAYPVTFQAETEQDRGMNLRVTVHSTGTGFSVNAQPGRTPGEFHIELPSGTYQLHAVQQVREHRFEADSRVTVSGRAVSGLVFHFAEVPTIPIQVAVDTSLASATASSSTTGQVSQNQIPTPQNLNLRLQPVGDPGEDILADVRVMTLPDKSFALQPGSGTYRLASQAGGAWFVERATYGTSDLLSQPLTITSGAGGEAIRVLVSNATGQVAGTVRRSGTGTAGWVYFLPHEPNLVPVYTARSAADGTYTQTVPPGTYSVVAFDHRFPGDLSDPATVAHLSGGVASTQVASGAKASLDLDLQAVETVQ